MKTCILDMETTDLKADFGRIICAVIKEYGTRRDYRVFKPSDYKNDSKTVLAIRDKLEKYHICVTHYGKGFDIPFLNSRLFIMGEQRLKPMFHVDTYYIAHYHLKAISRKSLKNLGDSLRLDEEKMNIPKWVWNGARDGDKECIAKIIKRCISDVKMTEDLYNGFLISGFIPTMRRV